jgi:hypothetical protein
MLFNIDYFTKGKTQERNEDAFGYSQNTCIIADGATDKSGRKYNDKTWGEIVAQLIVHTCLSCSLNGVELVNYINEETNKIYKKLWILEDTQDARLRFSAGFICVRIIENKIIITYIWDLGFRINGNDVYRKVKQVDREWADARSKYIYETGDIEWSREYIMPLMFEQFKYQNNSKESRGYGVIDGIFTPPHFVEVFSYDISDVHTLELFTDGYFDVPWEVSIKWWEDIHKKVEKKDPYKYKHYKSTKSSDDRTVMIITFK